MGRHLDYKQVNQPTTPTGKIVFEKYIFFKIQDG
jgi:hypothetical protein